METIDFLSKLQERLGRELPGYRAHVKMLPEVRRAVIRPEPGNTPRASSVLVLLFPSEGFYSTLLIQRTPDNSVHSGQISFPGGRQEPEDNTPVDTALREAWEEVGINPSHVKVVGELSPLYVSPSNFEIVPVIGFTEHLPELNLSIEEVAGVLELPLRDLAKTKQITDLQVRSFTLSDVPYFGLNGHIVWGATAMILQELADVMDEIIPHQD